MVQIRVILVLFCLAFFAASEQNAKAQQLLPAPPACPQFFSVTGQPLSGGLLYTYASGTSTPTATYTDATGAIANQNPIVLNSAGYPVSSTGSCGIWLTLGTAYRFVLQDSTGAQQWLVDNIPSSGVFTLPNTWSALQTFTSGISVTGMTTLQTTQASALTVTGSTNLNTANITSLNVLYNPSSIVQDPLLTSNYDNLFSYNSLIKTYTNTSNQIGLMNMNQMTGTPGAHGAYGFYSVADFTALGGGLGVGQDIDAYFKDVSAGGNANNTPAQANSATVEGSANFTGVVTAYQGVVENLGSGVITQATDYLAPNSGNLSSGSITTVSGFEALDQKALGTLLTVGFYAPPQTACGTCYGVYSDHNNNDLLGNLTITSLLINGGGTASLSGGLNASGTLEGSTVQATNTLKLVNMLASSTTPTISSGFGSSPSVTSGSNGTAAFRINVGTGGSASSGVIGMPAATAGWNCYVGNLSAHGSNRADDTVQTASSTNTVTVQNQTKSTGAAVAWTASDTIYLTCTAF